MPSPLGTHTRFASIEALCTAFTASPDASLGLAQAFFTRKTLSCELHVSRLVAFSFALQPSLHFLRR